MAVAVTSTLTSPSVAAGRVMAQEPMPGQEVTRGAMVHLIMSSGPARRRVPDLAKLDLDEAKALLGRFGFTVVVTSVIDPSYEGKILKVEPAPGADVPLPATVRLTVSAGPPKVTAPDVVGLTLGEAEAKLDSAGLRLGRVNYDSASVTDLGAIEGQRPAAGDSVRQGGSVSVVVSGRAPYVAPVDSLAPADGTTPVPPAGEPQGEPPPPGAASQAPAVTPPASAPKPAATPPAAAKPAPPRADGPATARPPVRTGTPAPAKPPVRPAPATSAPRPQAPSNDGKS
jgi:beta-lactam-binding protein with PASTA domain